MGLLDAMDSPDMAMAMGLLGSGGYSRMPISTGQGLAAGYGAYQDAKKQQQAQQQSREMFDIQKQQHQLMLTKEQRAQTEQDTAKAKLQQYYSSLPEGHPQKAMLEQADKMGVPPTDVWKKLNPEAKFESSFDAQGREVKGWVTPNSFNQVGGAKAMPLHFANTGGAIQGLDPMTGLPVGQGIATQPSPDARLSAGTAMRGQNMTDSRARDLLAQGGKAPSGYRFTPTGDMEYVPGGPADMKAQALAGNKAAGSADVGQAIATLRNAYDRLESGGGITNTQNNPLQNMGAALSSSGVGQAFGKMVGSENQSARNDVAMTRPALLAALMKATGMSSKQMDSNAELKLWMTTATDPSLDVGANRRALDNIERKYLGANAAVPQAPMAAAPSRAPMKGQIVDGFKFNGGDPSSPASWVKQ